MTTDTHVIDIIDAPTALIGLPYMQYNITRMQHRMNALGVKFRPHVKTTRCLDIVRAQVVADAQDITVSTLKEAEAFFIAGIKGILYAMGIVATRLPRVMALCKQDCDLKLVVDNAEAVHAVVDYTRAHGGRCEVWIEINTDGHHSDITPEQGALLEVGRVLKNGGIDMSGVMAHASFSYDLNDRVALAALAEQECAGCVRAAQRLCEAGVPCAAVNVNSTPTALTTEHLEGVTEVRAGIYVFFDLVMHSVDVYAMDEIALGVLATMIGHRPDKGQVVADVGWVTISRDRGTAKQSHDFGCGQPCTLDGTPLEGLTLIDANRKHDILAANDGSACADLLVHFSVNMKLYVLPNYACATGAQFPEHQAVSSRSVMQTWARFHGW